MDIIFLIGRILLAGIFLVSAVGHFANREPMGQYATSKGVPNAETGVVVSGVIAGLAGLSLILGLWIDVGALLLIVFLVPVSLLMHPYWKETDPQARQGEQVNFMKNMALIGAALILFYFVNQTQVVQIGLTDPLFGAW